MRRPGTLSDFARRPMRHIPTAFPSNRATKNRALCLVRIWADALNRWIAEALIDHHRVIEKIRADIPAGELTLENMEGFNDQSIARGVGETAADAIKTMSPLQWRAPRNA
jgi:hypothetical protein